MSVPLKALATVAGIGTASVGAYLVIPRKKALSIRAQLERAGYSILNLDKKDTVHKGEWDKIKDAYGKETTALLRFEGIVQGTDSTINGMKDACSLLLSSESNKAEDLEKARRWCVVPVDVSSRLSDKFALLDTTGTNDSNLWTEKLTEHKKDNPKFPKIPNAWGDGDNEDSKKIAALKTKCGNMAKLHTFDKDFESFLSYTRDWCTKPKN
ncbi:hypothetical protein MHC_04555 [Mycoplasma haemocanis str. Illinois]|uniref:Uncharacterized protein n=1 Tax=Mycoplasma haemocanis (strain Illinois) TaxID=1111676 RepID=H6N7Z5_MYCHN|nr:hypothetical protein [Mycoplasma haemocanis]AEW45767.1 hypothetical protein MHC_04555 [Mycoplasma haemocanis str. Illinois]